MCRKDETKATPEVLDEKGSLNLPPPPQPRSVANKVMMYCVLYLIIPVVAPVLLILLALRKGLKWGDLRELYHVVRGADANPIDNLPTYKDPKLLSKLYQLDSTKHYLQHGLLEWQKQEGYCAHATLRCILKSFPTYPTHLLPEAKHGESNPDRWCGIIRELAEQQHADMPSIETEIIRGDVSYQVFLSNIRKVDEKQHRVAINYLRPVLFGFPRKPWWIPIHLLLGLLSGHFSPILGVLEQDGDEEPLVAVWDVNHNYGGVYLVPAPRLYDSVKAMDVTTQQARAVVVVSQQL